MSHKKGRIASSWELLCTCWKFLVKNKDLIFIPIFSLITNTILLALFITGGIFTPMLHHFTNESIVIGTILLLLLYFSIAFVTLFANSALVACSSARLQGQPLSVTGGIAKAYEHLPQIFKWCCITSLVGLVLNLLESTHNRFAELTSRLLGVAWSLCSYFVLPILILENKGTWEAFNKSRKTFTENWRRVISINLIFGLIFMGVLLMTYGFHRLYPFVTLLTGGQAAVIGLIAFLFMITIGSTLGVISNSALYLHLFQNVNAPVFNKELLDNIMVQRKRRLR